MNLLENQANGDRAGSALPFPITYLAWSVWRGRLASERKILQFALKLNSTGFLKNKCLLIYLPLMGKEELLHRAESFAGCKVGAGLSPRIGTPALNNKRFLSLLVRNRQGGRWSRTTVAVEGTVSVRIFGHYVSLPLLLLMLAEAAIHTGAVYLAAALRFQGFSLQVNIEGAPAASLPRAPALRGGHAWRS